MDFFEDLLKKPSLFLDESKLDTLFIPEQIPIREKELSLLSQLFLNLITSPNSISRKILIVGPPGVGKTVTIKVFGQMLESAAEKRSVNIKYVHINCRKEKTSYKVLIRIISALDHNFPKRGYSPQDLLDIIADFVRKRNIHLVLAIDEISYLIMKGDDLLYSLTTINDDSFNNKQHISIICIARNLSFLDKLDIATLSILKRNIIKFKFYSMEQIFNILKHRVNISIKKDVISDSLLETISKISLKEGDIRVGFNILWKATKIAESRNLKYVTVDCVNLATQDTVPFSLIDILEYMTPQKLVLLYALIKALEENEKRYLTVRELVDYYNSVCKKLGIKNKSYSQVWNYLQEFKRENIIEINVKSDSIKGRKSFISILESQVPKLKKTITQILETKGINL